MKIYTLSPQGISKIRQQFLKRMNIILGIVCFAFIAITLWNASDNWPITLAVSIIICAGIMIFGPSRALHQNREIWESIRIEITDEYIARSQVPIPQVRINRQEIVSIDEIGSGLCIRTTDKLRTLVIPNNLDASDYQEIKSKLMSWSTIQPKSPKEKSQNTLLLIALIIGYGILFLSWSLWIVLITGVLITGYYTYFYWSLQQAEGVDPRFRRNMLYAFLFPLFFTAMKIWLISGGFETLIRFLNQSS